MWTWMETSRPEKLTLGVTFCTGSDLEDKNTLIFHLDLKHRKNTYKNLSVNQLFYIIVVVQKDHGVVSHRG